MTARKSPEEALSIFDQVFLQLAGSIREVFWLASSDHRESFYVSPAYDDVFGRSREDFSRNPRAWLECIHPEDRPRIEERLGRNPSEPYEWEYRIVRPDGSVRWIHARGFPVRDEQGRVFRTAGVAEDITARKLAENASKATHRLLTELGGVRDLPTTLRICLDAAFEASGMESGGIYLRERNGGLRLAIASGLSDEFISASSYYAPESPSALLVMNGRPVYAVYPDSKVPLDQKQDHEALRAVAMIPIMQGDCVFGSLNVASRTLDELSEDRKVALESIASELGLLITRSQADEELCLSEARYRAIVEDQTDIIGRLKDDGTITFANDAYCRFVGKTAADLIGSRWQGVAFADDLPEVRSALQKLSPATPVVGVENRVYSGAGELRWMHFVNRGLFDAEEQLIEIQFVGRDITERKHAELALRESERKLQEHRIALEQKNAALRELIEQLSAKEAGIRANVVANIEDVVIPLVTRLPLRGTARRYLQIIERHLRDVTSSYSRRVVRRRTSGLTPREAEICDMIKAGLSTKDIAETLGLSVQTIQRHRRNIRQRLNLTRTKQNLVSFLASEADGYESYPLRTQ